MRLVVHGGSFRIAHVKYHTQDDRILGRLQIHLEHNKVKAFLALITIIETWGNNALQVDKVRLLMDISIDGLSRLMIERISKITNPYRPDRKFERPHCRMIRVKYAMAYKRPC